MNPILEHFDVTCTRMPNGLRVLVREDHSAPVVAIFTHVLAGYFDEPDELVGVSHVLEHMFFKGTPTRGPGTIAQETKSVGGFLNASTIYDHTSYYTVVPAAALAEAMAIQSDALINSLIDEEELRKELVVIIEEAKRKLDNPSAVARESLFALMFDRHRMRRWRIGTEEQLRTYTRVDVAGFFERLYTTESVILVVAGAVSKAHVLELVNQHYHGLRNGAAPRDRGEPESPCREFRFHEIAGDVAQARIELGWHTVPTQHADTPHLDLLALMLGQGRASLLHRTVRDAGLASNVSAYNYAPTELGVFGISADTAPVDVLACLQQVCACVESIRADRFTDTDLQRAKNVLEAVTLRSLETMEGQASFLAEWEALGDWRLGLDYLNSTLTADRNDIVRAARTYLDLDNVALLYYRPADSPALSITRDMLAAHAD